MQTRLRRPKAGPPHAPSTAPASGQGCARGTKRGERGCNLGHERDDDFPLVGQVRRWWTERPVGQADSGEAADGHQIHKAELINKYVASLDGKLRLFYLPPYSPQLNSDEQV